MNCFSGNRELFFKNQTSNFNRWLSMYIRRLTLRRMTSTIILCHISLGKFDVGALIDMVILDFSKAFDTVPHQKLLHKMRQYGADGNINVWLCDFLTNRKMKVVIDGKESDTVTLDSGVPQGIVGASPVPLPYQRPARCSEVHHMAICR